MTDELAQRRRHNQMLIDRVQGVPAVETGAASEDDPNAPAPTGDSAGKLAAAIAHKVLDHLNSTPIDEDEERDDWCVVRDIARDVIAPALRQPPQPTGDVGDIEQRAVVFASRNGMGGYPPVLRMMVKFATAELDRSNSRFHDMESQRNFEIERADGMQADRDMWKARAEAAEQALRTAREALEQINAVCTDNLAVPTANTRMALDFVRQVAVAALTGAGEEGE